MGLEQLLGVEVMVLFLADIFFTVLYARAGTGLLAPRWNRLIWAVISGAARLSRRHRSTIFAFGGPLAAPLKSPRGQRPPDCIMDIMAMNARFP